MPKHKWYDVIVAWAEGKTIQYKDVRVAGTTSWNDVPAMGTPRFDEIRCDWRVKPERKVGWINIYRTSDGQDTVGKLHSTKEDALIFSKSSSCIVACVKLSYIEGEGLDAPS